MAAPGRSARAPFASPTCCGCRAGCASWRRKTPTYDPSRGYPDHLYVYTGAIDAHRWAITRPPQWPPNTVGRYRNSDPLVLNHLIKKAVLARGEEYLSYPQRRLFDKLGIRHMVLETDPYGNFLLQGYELGPARDWLRLGAALFAGWRVERRAPLATRVVRLRAHARARVVAADVRGHVLAQPDEALAAARGRLFMAGAGGQYAFIIPTHDLVVVRLGHYKGVAAGETALWHALELLTQLVPQNREPWQPPLSSRR